MLCVIQRVKSAKVTIDSKETREIGKGLVVLLGVKDSDTNDTADKVVEKIVNLRIFSNDKGKFDYSVKDIKGSILLVSQFTLYADLKKGRRPDFTDASKPGHAKKIYEYTLNALEETGVEVKSGEFGSSMVVSIENDGPVTIILDSDKF